jgi:hypothetical protein
MDAVLALAKRDEAYAAQLKEIGQAIGYGRAQQILGDLWDGMLADVYGAPPGRGRSGVTIDDTLPPVPKPTKLRREMLPDGGYQMVPAYTVPEMKKYAHAAVDKAAEERKAPRWWTCQTHGDAKPNAWGCPECVREMRQELAALQPVPRHEPPND